MDPEPECVFCRRRMEEELRDGLCDMDSIEELLRERSAFEKTRGFFPSTLSNPLLLSVGIGTGGVLRVGRVLLFHFSAFMLTTPGRNYHNIVAGFQGSRIVVPRISRDGEMVQYV